MNKVSAIVAVDSNWGIGLGQDLLIKDKVDQAFFAGYTMGKTCLVGWNTFQTLPKLTGRLISLDLRGTQDLKRLDHCSPLGEVVVIGGAVTYAKYADQIEEVYITIFEEELDSDKWFDVYLFQHLDERVIVFKGDGFKIWHWS